jgi:hypothetical protein
MGRGHRPGGGIVHRDKFDGLPAARSHHRVADHRGAFLDGAETGLPYADLMQQDVVGLVRRGNEAVALDEIEPFNLAGHPCGHSRAEGRNLIVFDGWMCLQHS